MRSSCIDLHKTTKKNMFIECNQLTKNLYETDYDLWVMETVKQLENKEFDAIDLVNLIEEVLDLSRRDRKKLKNLLRNLIEHLLKLKYWEAERSNNLGHWQGEITNFRKQIRDELDDSPSLKPYLQEIFAQCYQDGREVASIRSQLPLDIFPITPIANLEQVLDETWLPY
jgi:DNA repair ATPase RecN